MKAGTGSREQLCEGALPGNAAQYRQQQLLWHGGFYRAGTVCYVQAVQAAIHAGSTQCSIARVGPMQLHITE